LSVRRSIVAGCGSYLPAKVLTNAELAQRLETSDEWIRQRTGIGQRYIAADGELTSDLATKAADAALKQAGISASAVDLIVLATATPDETFPATATVVQNNLGIHRGAAFDIQAVCSAVMRWRRPRPFCAAGRRTVSMISETFSRILDWNDRGTCVLFGDGAGAVVLQAGEGQGTSADRGILSTHLFSDGQYHDLLYVDGGPSSTRTSGLLRMAGKEVFRHAVVKLAQAVDAALTANNIKGTDVDWLVPHQANRRIIDAMAEKLHLPPERVVVTIERHANTSAASIPLAMAEAAGDGRIQKGQLVLLEGMGGGFTWGSALIRW
jgi:3-oxoacyl-[acyl-carrier-protein] synthase-3